MAQPCGLPAAMAHSFETEGSTHWREVSTSKRPPSRPWRATFSRCSGHRFGHIRDLRRYSELFLFTYSIYPLEPKARPRHVGLLFQFVCRREAVKPAPAPPSPRSG